MSWAVSAATPANTSPTPSQDRPNATDPATGSPKRTMTSAAMAPSVPAAVTAVSSAAVSGARRPTDAAPTSSRRPVSSSARVCRTTSRTHMTATIALPVEPTRQALTPPTVWSFRTGP